MADFRCTVIECGEEFELKSKNGSFGRKTVDGAYKTMMNRLSEDNNPNLILLSYDRIKYSIETVQVVPRQFFTSGIIEQRPALSQQARRKGWVGCNILIGRIPPPGRIDIIDHGKVTSAEEVSQAWKRVMFVRAIPQGSKRGWLLAVLEIVETMRRSDFTLDDVYAHASDLAIRFPGNAHVFAKIRQQLQVLRDQGVLKFLGNGKYMRIAQA